LAEVRHVISVGSFGAWGNQKFRGTSLRRSRAS
jgi:hypothetical protein